MGNFPHTLKPKPSKYYYVTKGYGADGDLFTIKKFEIEDGREVRERVIVYNSEGGVDTN